MISHKAVGSMALVIIAVGGIRAGAEDPTASELYGRGVHAYFAHDFDTAVTLLSESIAQRSTDPRAYYFRGLALAARHGVESGLADFSTGAELEITRPDNHFYDVNGALQRVQGAMRMALERQRGATRLAALERKKKQDRIKFETLQRREDVVLFRPDQAAAPVALELPEVDKPASDPFRSGVVFSGGQQVQEVVPVVPVVAAADAGTAPDESARDPFAEPGRAAATPKKKPNVENPFGEMAAEVDPDDPVFDEEVRPELPPGMNLGGTILDLLDKTLSGKAGASADRDPFGDGKAESSPPAEATPPAEDPGTQTGKKSDNPFD